MTKPRHIRGLINRVMGMAPKLSFLGLTVRRGATLTVHAGSLSAYIEMRDEIELPVVFKEPHSHVLTWDLSELGRGPREVVPFRFDGRDEAKRNRRAVTSQEEEAGDLIGGRAHPGSGALSGLKSDASSDDWQLEAKQTIHQSIGLKFSWLSKIVSEARVHGKKPIVHLRFTDVPDDSLAEEDWVVIPKSVFEEAKW